MEYPGRNFCNMCWWQASVFLVRLLKTNTDLKKIWNSCVIPSIINYNKYMKEARDQPFRIGDQMPIDLLNPILIRLNIGVKYYLNEKTQNKNLGSTVKSHVINGAVLHLDYYGDGGHYYVIHNGKRSDALDFSKISTNSSDSDASIARKLQNGYAEKQREIERDRKLAIMLQGEYNRQQQQIDRDREFAIQLQRGY